VGDDIVLPSVEGTVGIIELARPAVFNCLSIRAFDLIRGALRRFEADPSVRAILLRAQGKNFCTGAELGGVTSAPASQSS
jgi:enoyl-CoA hydratase/carnithine racemase